MTGISLSGFKEFETKLKNLPGEINEEIDGEVEIAAKEWEGLAKLSARTHIDQGRLAGEINANKIKQMEWDVESPAEYSAYVEWGTRSQTVVPAELAGYAAQFRGSTASLVSAKTMIYAWAERKGIPKEKWWMVFINLMTKGSFPHPFFFIHKNIVESNFIFHVRNILKTPH